MYSSTLTFKNLRADVHDAIYHCSTDDEWSHNSKFIRVVGKLATVDICF